MSSCCTPSKSGKKTLSSGNEHKISRNSTSPDSFSFDMIKIERNEFLIGAEVNDSEANLDDCESPQKRIFLESFSIASTTVTNTDFKKFVDETSYETDAEKFGWSFVFQGQLSKALKKKYNDNKVGDLNWWYAIEKARWDKPSGPGSNITKIMNHPVVHVSYNDALSYCEWSGTKLPSEAEWEAAARAGQTTRFPWGDDLKINDKLVCNVWNGEFPNINLSPKHMLWTSPAKSFKPNSFGLYNVCGNVWEWTTDDSNINTSPDGELSKIIKGGSFLCHKSYCNRYRLSARTSNTIASSSSNIGFRVTTRV